MERYSRKELAVVMYHLHIPYPDPMTNPSTEARAKSCGVYCTPSFAIDGKMATAGGSRDEAQSFYDKLNLQVEKRLEAPAEARLTLNASLEGGVVKARVIVDNVRSKSSDLKLQIALIEDHLTYSGQNGVRFHPMVVRSLGGEKGEGFAVNPLETTTVEQSFDVGKIAKELKAYLEDFEKKHWSKTAFTQKKHEIHENGLSVAAFVQDAKSKQVLQAAFVKVKPEAVASNR